MTQLSLWDCWFLLSIEQPKETLPWFIWDVKNSAITYRWRIDIILFDWGNYK